jgi:hypothetical protein
MPIVGWASSSGYPPDLVTRLEPGNAIPEAPASPLWGWEAGASLSAFPGSTWKRVTSQNESKSQAMPIVGWASCPSERSLSPVMLY